MNSIDEEYEVAYTGAQLAVIAEITGLPPVYSATVVPDGAMWDEVLAGLVARGVLEVDGDDVVLRDPHDRWLRSCAAAPLVVSVTCDRSERSEHAVLYAWPDDTIHQRVYEPFSTLEVVATADLLRLIADLGGLLPTPDEPSTPEPLVGRMKVIWRSDLDGEGDEVVWTRDERGGMALQPDLDEGLAPIMEAVLAALP